MQRAAEGADEIHGAGSDCPPSAAAGVEVRAAVPTGHEGFKHRKVFNVTLTLPLSKKLKRDYSLHLYNNNMNAPTNASQFVFHCNHWLFLSLLSVPPFF